MYDFIDSRCPFGTSGLGIISGGRLDRINQRFSSHPSDDGGVQAHGRRAFAILVFGHRSNQTDATVGGTAVYTQQKLNIFD